MSDTGRPVVFVHGLWVHTHAWQPWMDLFASAGYTPHNPGWPGDADTAELARQDPQHTAGTGIDAVTAHYVEYISALPATPVLVGHSFGGLIAQKLLGLGHGVAGVVFSPANYRGVLPLPLEQLKNGRPVLGNPLNLNRSVALTKDQYHRGFASEVSREESDELWDRTMIPSPGKPLFEAAAANLNPWTAASVRFPADRGPLLIVAADRDRTVPASVSRYQHKLQSRKVPQAVTEFRTLTGRGHSFVLDHGWEEAAELARDWLDGQQLG